MPPHHFSSSTTVPDKIERTARAVPSLPGLVPVDCCIPRSAALHRGEKIKVVDKLIDPITATQCIRRKQQVIDPGTSRFPYQLVGGKEQANSSTMPIPMPRRNPRSMNSRHEGSSDAANLGKEAERTQTNISRYPPRIARWTLFGAKSTHE